MLALDALPPSVLSLDGAGTGSWLQADGTMVTVQRARTRMIATMRKVAAALVDKNRFDFTEDPPSSNRVS